MLVYLLYKPPLYELKVKDVVWTMVHVIADIVLVNMDMLVDIVRDVSTVCICDLCVSYSEQVLTHPPSSLSLSPLNSTGSVWIFLQ